MRFHKTVPILYSADVSRSLSYYIDVLGFESKWDWGSPPTFGGVCKGSVEIFFCEKGQGNPGTWLSLFIGNVDEYYETIKSKGAHILSAPETMEWGVREMLVEDPDGHKIRFGHGVSTRKKSTDALDVARIIQRTPTTKEHQELIYAVGWVPSMDEALAEKHLAAAVFSVVAEEITSGKTIGCALIMSDGISFYYVKDVIVHPDWQCKHIGNALMQEVSDWLDKNAAENAMVGLYTGDNLASFYQQFDFKPSFGMTRHLRTDNTKQ